MQCKSLFLMCDLFLAKLRELLVICIKIFVCISKCPYFYFNFFYAFFNSF